PDDKRRAEARARGAAARHGRSRLAADGIGGDEPAARVVGRGTRADARLADAPQALGRPGKVAGRGAAGLCRRTRCAAAWRRYPGQREDATCDTPYPAARGRPLPSRSVARAVVGGPGTRTSSRGPGSAPRGGVGDQGPQPEWVRPASGGPEPR